MAAIVKVLRSGVTVGGWKGSLEIDGDILRVTGVDPTKTLEIDTTQVKRYSFNGTNGLWALRTKNGKKLYL